MKQITHSRFTAGGKIVDVYPGALPNCPMIYLNTVSEEGEAIRQALEAMGSTDFSLAAVSGLEWNHDLAPWDIPPISPGAAPCTGGADDYLRLLLDKIMPQAEEFVPGKPCLRGLAGYSLAGLFAVYAMYRTDRFSRIASMSGSFWFPGFLEFAISQKLEKKPEYLYFSLGNKECKTKNEYLKTVRDHTEALAAFYKGQRIETEFRLNPGGHFTETIRRSALGIQWLLLRDFKSFTRRNKQCQL